METVVFRVNILDSIHHFNSKLIKVLHHYNAELQERGETVESVVFAPVHELCSITNELDCVGLAVSGSDWFDKIDLPSSLAQAFNIERYDTSSNASTCQVQVTRVNRKSKAHFKRQKEFYLSKGIEEAEAEIIVKKKRIANKSLMFDMPYFWYSNQGKGLHTPIYVKVSESVSDGHAAKNTLGFGVSSFHGDLRPINGKLVINQ